MRIEPLAPPPAFSAQLPPLSLEGALRIGVDGLRLLVGGLYLIAEPVRERQIGEDRASLPPGRCERIAATLLQDLEPPLREQQTLLQPFEPACALRIPSADRVQVREPVR
jgi:hypothetical protein